jgi:drug/metabolite transporter (DMT)-like permease
VSIPDAEAAGAAPPAHSAWLLPGLALTFNAFVWGVSWWPFRQLHDAGLHPLWATALIYVVAVALIAVTRPHALAQLARTPALWVLVVASGTTNAAFNWAVTIGDVVRVVLLFYLMPVWTLLLARLLLGERLRVAAVLRIGLGLAGAAIVLWPASAGGPDAGHAPHALADALGIVGGFSFALNNVMLRRERAQPEPARAVAMFIGGVAIGGGAAAVLAAQETVAWPPAPAPGWLGGALVLAFVFVASNLALQYGAARLPANRTAVIMLSEVLFATLSAAVLGGGALTPRSLLGGALIVAAAALAIGERRAAA